MGYPPASLGKYWLEGRDKDLFVAQAVDPEPKDWWGNGVINSVIYSRKLSTARPLPAGEYKFYFEALPAERVICSGHVELEKNTREWFITVAAPAGTLHEAFFDPVLDTSTSAVGADSTDGVLKPSAFTDSGGATTTIGSLDLEVWYGEDERQPVHRTRRSCPGLHRDGRLGIAVSGRRRRHR